MDGFNYVLLIHLYNRLYFSLVLFVKAFDLFADLKKNVIFKCAHLNLSCIEELTDVLDVLLITSRHSTSNRKVQGKIQNIKVKDATKTQCSMLRPHLRTSLKSSDVNKQSRQEEGNVAN